MARALIQRRTFSALVFDECLLLHASERALFARPNRRAPCSGFRLVDVDEIKSLNATEATLAQRASHDGSDISAKEAVIATRRLRLAVPCPPPGPNVPRIYRFLVRPRTQVGRLVGIEGQ